MRDPPPRGIIWSATVPCQSARESVADSCCLSLRHPRQQTDSLATAAAWREDRMYPDETVRRFMSSALSSLIRRLSDLLYCGGGGSKGGPIPEVQARVSAWRFFSPFLRSPADEAAFHERLCRTGDGTGKGGGLGGRARRAPLHKLRLRNACLDSWLVRRARGSGGGSRKARLCFQLLRVVERSHLMTESRRNRIIWRPQCQ